MMGSMQNFSIMLSSRPYNAPFKPTERQYLVSQGNAAWTVHDLFAEQSPMLVMVVPSLSPLAAKLPACVNSGLAGYCAREHF